jgi:hypothetical protein
MYVQGGIFLLALGGKNLKRGTNIKGEKILNKKYIPTNEAKIKAKR